MMLSGLHEDSAMPDWAIKILLTIIACLTIGFLFVAGCPRGPDDAAVITTALKMSPIPRDFRKLFPDSAHSIDYMKHRFPDGEYRWGDNWYGQAYLHNRYAIEMRFPFETNEDGTIALLDEPTFFFCELAEAGINEKGNPWFRHGESRSIDTNEWNKLVEVDGDCSVLGLTIIKDSPIKNFELWTQY